MSLGIVINGPEGLVLAAESRVSITAERPGTPPIRINFDNATKVSALSPPNNAVGFVNYGLAGIGWRTPHSYLPEFESNLPTERCRIDDLAQRLSAFFNTQWQAEMPEDYVGQDIVFVVGGFNEDEHFGRVFLFEIPGNPEPREQHEGAANFGITWGGQGEWVIRLIQGYDKDLPRVLETALALEPEQVQTMMQALQQFGMQIPLQAMALQDCVDLAAFFIRTTIRAQGLIIGVRGCGGPIDIATITRRQRLRFVQVKEIVGEA